jgi:hypothetical protein
MLIGIMHEHIFWVLYVSSEVCIDKYGGFGGEEWLFQYKLYKYMYWRRSTHILDRHGGSNLQDEYSNIGGLHGIAYLKSELDASIYWRCKS